MERLRATLENAYENVPFYRKKLDELGVKPGDVTCHGDVADLPFTTKIDLRDHYPFGMFARPRDQIVRVHASSGTTGNPTTVGYTRGDIDVWADLIARTLAAGGVAPGDLLQNAFGYGLFTGGLGLHLGAERLGCTVVPISGGNTERQLKIMRDFGATALSCTPSYAMYLADAARDRGLRPEDLPLRVGFHGAEPWTNELRVQIEAGLGITRSTSTASPRWAAPASPSSACARPACTSTRTTTSPRSSTPRRCGRCPTARSASSSSRPSAARPSRSSATAPATSARSSPSRAPAAAPRCA